MAERKIRTMEERFWSRVNKNGPIPVGHPEYEGLGPCWPYPTVDLKYPRSHKINDGPRSIVVARFSYQLAHGPIPPGQVIRHRCDNGHLR